jgi:hypothetical protein
MAEFVFLLPCLVVDILQSDSIVLTHEWVPRVADAVSGSEFVLNIAGPRESEAPGIYTDAWSFLTALFIPDVG